MDTDRNHLFGLLPLPLAQLYRRAHNAKTALERHLTAFYLWEAALKLLASTAIVEYADGSPADPAIAEKLQNLARPALGHWWSFARLLIPILADRGQEPFQKLRDLLLGKARDDCPRAAGLDALLRETLEGQGGARATVRFGELFDRLIAFRNVELGHGAAGQRHTEFYERMGPALLAGLTELFGRLDVLAGRRLIHVADVRRLASGNWLVERYELHGEAAQRLESLEVPEADAPCLPRPGRLYLHSPDETPGRQLHPLVIYDAETGRSFFLNARRGEKRADYLCYTTGEVVHRDDLGPEQRELLAKVLGGPVDPQAVEAWAARSQAEEPPTAAATSAPKTLGEFELISRLGRGGMGVVYRAWQPSLGRQVALKCLLRAGDPKAEARFAREIHALGKVEHPNLVKVFTSGAEGEQWFYAMELVDGADLAAVCSHLANSTAAELGEEDWTAAISTASERQRKQEQPLSADDAPADPVSPQTPPERRGGRSYVGHVVELVRQAAEATHALHEGSVIHRDIKPGNIMVSADGAHAVLMDLGLAQLMDESEGRLTRTRQFVGTLRYASPEQVLAAGRMDRRTDVYSLGATLWELLTLRPLFGANEQTPTPDLMERIQREDPERPRKHNPRVPADLEAIVVKCLEKDRGRRYATAADLAADLGRWQRGEPVLARPEGWPGRLWRKARRHRAALLSVLAGAVGLVVIAVLLVSGGKARQVANLEHDIDAGLMDSQVWTTDRLEAVESLIEKLRPLSPEHAADYQRRLRQRFRQDFADIRALPHLGDDDASRYRANAHALDAREPGAEKELLDLLDKQLHAWETIAELEPPFATGSRPFIRADLHVKEGALFRTAGLNPVAMLKTPAGSGMRIEAGFGKSWADSDAVGVYLNADRAYPAEVRSLALEGSFLASAGRDGVCLWDVRTEARKTLLQDPGPASCVALSRTALAAGRGREVLVWDLAFPPNQMARFDTHGGEVRGIAMSKDGRWLVTGSADGTVKLWELAGARALRPPTPVKTLQEAGKAVNQVAFAFDGQTLGVAGDDGTVRLWDAASWTPKDFVATHSGPVWSLALNYGGTILATATNGKVTFWYAREKRKYREVAAATAPVHCLAFDDWASPRVAVGNAIILMHGPGNGKAAEQPACAGAAAVFYKTTLAVADNSDGTVLLCDQDTGRPRPPVERLGGYSFLLARAPLTGLDKAEGAYRRSGGEGEIKRRYLQILRDGVCLRERAIDVHDGPLTVRATRDGAALEVQVNSLDPLAFQDAFPPPDRRGGFGLHWPVATGLTSLVLQRQARAPKPSALEEADDLFAQDKFDRARRLYLQEAGRARATDAVDEARYKAALCSEKGNRPEEAMREYEPLSRGQGRWAMLATCHLFPLLLQDPKNFARAEDALAQSGFWQNAEEVFLMLPEETRQRFIWTYYQSHVGVHLLFPRADLAESLEQMVRLTERVPDLPVGHEQSIVALMRAYQVLGRPEQALVLGKAHLDAVAAQRPPARDRLHVPAVLAEYTWLLQSRGKVEQALEELDGWLFEAPGVIHTDYRWAPDRVMLLLVERARLNMALARQNMERGRRDIALKHYKEAEEDVEHCLKLGAENRIWSAWVVTTARLIQGFAREDQGDKPGAARAWKEGSLGQAPGIGTDKAARLRYWSQPDLSVTEIVPQLIQAGLTKDFSEEEGKAIFDRILASVTSNKVIAGTIRAFADRSTYTAYGTMWQTERGRRLARQYVLHEIAFPEAVRRPAFLHGHEVVRQQAFSGTFTDAQDVLVWKLIQDSFNLLRDEKVSRELMFPLGKIWQSKPALLSTFLSWDPVAEWGAVAEAVKESPKVRGPLAYVLGRRRLQLDDKKSARSFFEAALEDAGPDSVLRPPTQDELNRLGVK